MNTKQILEHIGDLTYAPVTLIRKKREVFQQPKLELLSQLTARIVSQAFPSDQSVECIFTDEQLLFGIIRIQKGSGLALIGPLTTLPCDNRRAQSILRRYGMPSTKSGDLISYFGNLPTFSLTKFTKLLVFANDLINHEFIESSTLLPNYYRFNNTENSEADQQPSNPDADFFHNTQKYENELYALVRGGKTNELSRFLGKLSYTGNEGILASDMFRSFKNLLICSVTLTSRAAVDGGLDYESSMRHADSFIQRVELAQDLETLGSLNHSMLMTYTRLVAARKIGNPNSSLAIRTYNYVEQNIGTRLHAQQIADGLGISRSYLCTQFKKDTGMTVSDFIFKAKIDEAKRLLTTTEMPCVNIASVLDFSSQSHFQQVFKRLTGTTPKKYRGVRTQDH